MCQSWICFSPILGKCKSKYCKNAHKYYYNVLMNMRIWRYSMENIIHPIQAPRTIFFNSFLCVVLRPIGILWGSNKMLPEAELEEYQCIPVVGSEGNWELSVTRDSRVFSPPPQKKKPTLKLCTLDLRCQRKVCYLVNYNLGHLCCRLTHRVLTQKDV